MRSGVILMWRLGCAVLMVLSVAIIVGAIIFMERTKGDP
jgi:hypothetical protein